MSALPSLPWSKINDFLLRVCSARNLSEFKDLVSTHMADLIWHDFPILCIDITHIKNDVSYEIEHPNNFIDPGIFAVAGEPGTVADFNTYFRFHLPLTTGYFIDRLVADFRPFANTEFVTDFIRPRKIAQCLGGWWRSYTVIVPRRKPARPFSERETLISEIISPHLENFYNVLCLADTIPETPRLHDMRIDPLLAGLTRREKEIALLLSERLSMAEIAVRLFISRRTVEKHAENIYQKLGVKRKQEIGKSLLNLRPYGLEQP